MGTVHLLPDGVVLLFLAPAPFVVALPSLFFVAVLGCAALLPPDCEILLSQASSLFFNLFFFILSFPA